MEDKKIADELTEILKKLHNSTYGIESVVLSDAEGLPIASLSLESFNEEAVASQASVAIGICAVTLEKMKKGEMEQVYMSGKFGKIYVFQVWRGVTLTLVTTKEPKSGMILFAAYNAVKSIAKLMDKML